MYAIEDYEWTTFYVNLTLDINGTVCNETYEDCSPPRNPKLQLAYNILVPVILVIIMLSMGAGITVEEVKNRLRQPVGPIIGLVCQFILLPAMCFGLAHALRLLPHHAVGMMVVASCPGGTVSNIFTLWSKGDLALSVVMTAISTVLALGFMPLNLFIYLRSWTSNQAQIPFANIAIIVVLTWIPVIIGLIIKRHAPKAAPIITRIGSILGLVVILITGVIQRQLYPEMFGFPWQVWFGAFIQPLLSFGLGFGIAAIARRNIEIQRTVAYETGMQNVGLALSIIALSFSGVTGSRLTQYPLIYAIAQMVVGIGSVIIHRIYFAAVRKKKRLYDIDPDWKPSPNQPYEKEPDSGVARDIGINEKVVRTDVLTLTIDPKQNGLSPADKDYKGMRMVENGTHGSP